MTHRKIVFLSIIGASLVLVGQQIETEAPGRNYNSHSSADDQPNGRANSECRLSKRQQPNTEPPGDTFALDQAQFERKHDATTGLGPVFNATACSECHQNGVTGAASQITEVRVGHRDANGNFVNPTILINSGANSISGRSIVNRSFRYAPKRRTCSGFGGRADATCGA